MFNRPVHRFLTLFGILIIITGIGCRDGMIERNTFTPDLITLTETGGGLKALADDSLTFCDPDGNLWVAPHGTFTDGASVPRLALWLTDGKFEEEFLKAAVVHDAYCQKDNAEQCPEQYRTRPWRDVHRMFYRACLANGTPKLKAKIMFAAVWIGGPKWQLHEDDRGEISGELLRIGFDSCQQYIEETDGSLPEIEAWVAEREPTLREISEIEAVWRMALNEENMETADEVLHRADIVLDEALTRHPEDLLLLNLRGYQHSNRAETLERMGRTEEAAGELDRAEETFQVIRDRRPTDPSAASGLHRIEILRNRPDLVEEDIHQMLEAEPEHPVARRNLEMIERHPIEPPMP